MIQSCITKTNRCNLTLDTQGRFNVAYLRIIIICNYSASLAASPFVAIRGDLAGKADRSLPMQPIQKLEHTRDTVPNRIPVR